MYVFDKGDGVLLTTDKTGEASYTFGDQSQDNHFSISLEASGDLENNKVIENMIYVYDATSGDYKGLIKDFFELIYKKLESSVTPELAKLNPKLKRLLVIDSDRSDGAWQHLARTLSASYQTS